MYEKVIINLLFREFSLNFRYNYNVLYRMVCPIHVLFIMDLVTN
jgi:hypothetical protein